MEYVQTIIVNTQQALRSYSMHQHSDKGTCGHHAHNSKISYNTIVNNQAKINHKELKRDYSATE